MSVWEEGGFVQELEFGLRQRRFKRQCYILYLIRRCCIEGGLWSPGELSHRAVRGVSCPGCHGP